MNLGDVNLECITFRDVVEEKLRLRRLLSADKLQPIVSIEVILQGVALCSQIGLSISLLNCYAESPAEG